MTIRRAPSEVRATFTIIPNVSINDTRLSWEALGLLTFLLSKPDNWFISPAHLVKQRVAGKHRVYKMLKELEDFGYIRVEDVRQSGQFAGVDRVVYDMSRMEPPQPEPVKPEELLMKRKPKTVDPLFDAIAEACSIDPGRLTSSARGQINKAVKELRDTAADAQSVAAAAKEYRKRFPDAALTPSALAKHYPALAPTLSAPREQKRTPCEPCSGTGWQSTDDERTVVRCASCAGAGFLGL
jgi:excinuclease UvrABC ATPase subunit